MTCGNPIKHKIQNIFGGWFDMLSNESRLTDDQMECMQFGIVIMLQDKLRKSPFFIII